jgi:uncharacterized protein
MELQGNVTLPANPEQVWRSLNDPEVLRQCIPGCEELRQISPEELHARITLKLGPVRASFVGKVRLTDVRPLQGCTLNFEGSGGSAGFAKGSSVITLSALLPEGTQLDYSVQASVAGKLGQIGGRLIDASARQLADHFFNAFQAHFGCGSSATLPALAPHASGAISLAGQTDIAAAAPGPGAGWLALEKSRLLWFGAGVGSTVLGVVIGAHWLR